MKRDEGSRRSAVRPATSWKREDWITPWSVPFTRASDGFRTYKEVLDPADVKSLTPDLAPCLFPPPTRAAPFPADHAELQGLHRELKPERLVVDALGEEKRDPDDELTAELKGGSAIGDAGGEATSEEVAKAKDVGDEVGERPERAECPPKEDAVARRETMAKVGVCRSSSAASNRNVSASCSLVVLASS